MQEPMSELPQRDGESSAKRPAASRGVSELWLILPVSILALSAGAALARLAPNFKWESLPILAAAIATALFALLLNRRLLRTTVLPEQEAIGEGMRQLLDSAGPGVVAMDLNGRLVYCNPSAVRLLGYPVAELAERWGTMELLAPGEGDRLLGEMQKLCHVKLNPETTPAGRMVAYLACLRALSPSTVPTFDTHVIRKDGAQVPVHTARLCAARRTGRVDGHGGRGRGSERDLHREQAQRESQERYRDLFERRCMTLCRTAARTSCTRRSSTTTAERMRSA